MGSCTPDEGERDAGGSVVGPDPDDDFMRASRSKKKSSRTNLDSKKQSHVFSLLCFACACAPYNQKQGLGLGLGLGLACFEKDTTRRQKQ